MIGVCLGASSISLVKVALNDNNIEIIDVLNVSHNGNPKEALIDLLSRFNPEALPIVATGRKFRNLINFTNISEPRATELALEFINTEKKYNAVASLGGETFIVYTLHNNKITNIISKNQCASGTGEFFLQQIKRMDMNIDDMNIKNNDAVPYKVSGRCSVFCKSDCTHALNKGIPKSEVTAGLSQMIAEKIEELLIKSKSKEFLIIGGVTKNKSVIKHLRKKISGFDIPEEASYFEALGAAIYGLKNKVDPFPGIENIFNSNGSSFVFHKPLIGFSDKVIFHDSVKGKANKGDECILGLDVGSTTTKAVIIRVSDDTIISTVYLYTNGDPIGSAKKCYQKLHDEVNDNIKIIGLGVTGSGRHIAGLHAMTDGIYNEIIAHATAALHFDNEVDTIFEIGGQDAKYTHIINKVPADYAMNEACSAGTGSFIEESALESLGIKVTDIEGIALKADSPPNFNDQCAAFIGSDIKTAQQEGISKTNITAGLVYSICLNYLNRVKGNRPVGKKVFMQGGVCYNKSIPIAMAALSGIEIIVPPEPGLMGAYGVALEVKEKINLGFLSKSKFDLQDLAIRQVSYHKSFICPGTLEKCDRACSINMIEVLGKKYPFGGACNKYYNSNSKKRVKLNEFDLVRIRQELIKGADDDNYVIPENATTIGINNTFHFHNLYPLFYHFFSELGFRIVLSDKINDEGVEQEQTSMCFPAQISHGMFHDLISKKTDYIFIPNIIEINTDDKIPQRLDFNCSCIFVSGEPYYLKQAFKDFDIQSKFLTPIFNFGNGFEGAGKAFFELAKQIGINDKQRINDAIEKAILKQTEFKRELLKRGREFLDKLDESDDYAIVLVGRPYNSFTGLANKGIPQKFASRGIHIVPYDMLESTEETIDTDMYWESGKKILRSAKSIKNNEKLFACYVTNFSCAPDSMIVPLFRDIMGDKPSLTLELDSHSADAGINTRIDAFVDIIENYRKLSGNRPEFQKNGFNPAKVIFENDKSFFIASNNKRLPLNDPGVKILIPSMGDLSARLFAAGLRSQGFNAETVSSSNPDILKYGRANSTGKECLPLILCIGGIIDYIENKWDGKEHLAFFIVQGAGNCRLGYYPTFIKNVINKKQIPNVTTIELMHEDGFAGLGPHFASRGIQMLIAGDVLEDIRNAILTIAVDPDVGIIVFEEEYNKLLNVIQNSPDSFYKALNKFASNIKSRVPLRESIENARYVALLGEMYVRRDHFAHKWLNKYFAEKGFIVKDAYISEWIFYVDYLLKEGHYEPLKSIKNKYERFVRVSYMRIAEHKIKKILEKTGYYKFSRTNVKPLVEHGKHVIPLEFKGEPLLILGTVIHEAAEKYCGVISIGPFGCMQSRFAEAVTIPESTMENKLKIKKQVNPGFKMTKAFNGNNIIPFLTIETDGNVYPQVVEAKLETFTLQAERMAEIMNGNNQQTE